MTNALKELTAAVGETADRVNGYRGEIQAVQQDVCDLKKALTSNGVGGMLSRKYGQSGAADWLHEMGEFARAVVLKVSGGVPADLEEKFGANLVSKAVADFTTTTDATAGYLVPEILWPDLDTAVSLYGNLLARVRKLTIPPGATAKINAESTTPTAAWRKSQGATMTELEATYGQASLTPVLIGGYVKVANELWEYPGVRFGEWITNAIIRSMVEKIETGLIQGDEDALGTDADPPSDGLLLQTATSDQTNIAADTEAAWLTFIDESITDSGGLADVNRGVLLTTYAKWFALLADRLTNSVTLTEVNPQRFAGYDVVLNSAMLISATSYIAMIDPDNVWYASSGRYAVDANPWGDGFLHNETWLRVLTHCDWGFPTPAKISKADFA